MQGNNSSRSGEKREVMIRCLAVGGPAKVKLDKRTCWDWVRSFLAESPSVPSSASLLKTGEAGFFFMADFFQCVITGTAGSCCSISAPCEKLKKLSSRTAVSRRPIRQKILLNFIIARQRYEISAGWSEGGYRATHFIISFHVIFLPYIRIPVR